MPWRNLPVCEQRLVLVNLIEELHMPLAQAAREMGVSRKTAYKWLSRWRAAPHQPQLDQSPADRIAMQIVNHAPKRFGLVDIPVVAAAGLPEQPLGPSAALAGIETGGIETGTQLVELTSSHWHSGRACRHP
jgi:hypothetical protein